MPAPIPVSSLPVFVRADWKQLDEFARNKIVAFYMYNYRNRQHWSRLTDPDDEYYKAAYLNRLADYFFDTHAIVIPMIDGDPYLDDIIKMVYNIHDRAYFHKIHHLACSDSDCFIEAERYYCKEKALDYLAFLTYLKRSNQGQPGDEKTDYYTAQQNHCKWRKQFDFEGVYGCVKA
jgi:hypothetical protein